MADVTVYVEFFGIIAIFWQWLIQATAAKKALAGKPEHSDINFYQGYFSPAPISSATSCPRSKVWLSA